MSAFTEFVANVLLFAIVFGMSASVDINQLKSQLRNKKSIITGIVLQFFFMPFVGFLVVKIFNLSYAVAVTLLVITSSPGGTYSNWWCSVFNADLALSVCMTAISTVASIFLLPLNLFIYTNAAFDDDVMSSFSWGSLYIAVVIVVAAIAIGVNVASKKNTSEFHHIANKVGNFSGMVLFVFSMFLTITNDNTSLFGRDWQFYVGVASPCLVSVAITTFVSSQIGIEKAERVTLAIEVGYQNIGIATSMVLTMFEGSYLTDALGVPLFYGFIECLIIFTYCYSAWKQGWTKAPADESFQTILITSYELTSDKDTSIDMGNMSNSNIIGSPYNVMRNTDDVSVASVIL